MRHPASGEVLGVIDLSGPRGTATPDTRGLVRSAARVVETLLTSQASVRSDSACSSGIPCLDVRLLAEPAMARVGGGDWFVLPTRAAEILALLSLRERGWSAEEMAYELYGEHGTPSTVRTEIHRVRRRLGAESLTPQRCGTSAPGCSPRARLTPGP